MSTQTSGEKLAHRLVKLIELLTQGKGLEPQQLADSFKVSVRTIQRDIERLEFLHLQKRDGMYWLPSRYLGLFTLKDIRNLASLAGVTEMFPTLDITFINQLLSDHIAQLYAVKGQSIENASQYRTLFQSLEKGIAENKSVEFQYKDTWRTVNPYRLIQHHGSWYLAGTENDLLKVFRLSKVQGKAAWIGQKKFKPDAGIVQKINNEDSIWFGEDKQEVILSVNAAITAHFKARDLLPEQEILKELDNGDLLVSAKITHTMQILPLVRYWLPDMRIISPVHLESIHLEFLKQYTASVSHQ